MHAATHTNTHTDTRTHTQARTCAHEHSYACAENSSLHRFGHLAESQLHKHWVEANKESSTACSGVGAPTCPAHIGCRLCSAHRSGLVPSPPLPSADQIAELKVDTVGLRAAEKQAEKVCF